MPAVGQRQPDLPAARGEGREDGQGQLHGFPSGEGATERLALLLDRGQQVAHGAEVPAVEKLDVRERLGLTEAGRGWVRLAMVPSLSECAAAVAAWRSLL